MATLRRREEEECVMIVVYISCLSVRLARPRRFWRDGGEQRLICVWLLGGGLLRSLLDVFARGFPGGQ